MLSEEKYFNAQSNHTVLFIRKILHMRMLDLHFLLIPTQRRRTISKSKLPEVFRCSRGFCEEKDELPQISAVCKEHVPVMKCCDFRDSKTCEMCLAMEGGEIRSLPCSHTFHRARVDTSRRASSSNCCSYFPTDETTEVINNEVIPDETFASPGFLSSEYSFCGDLDAENSRQSKEDLLVDTLSLSSGSIGTLDSWQELLRSPDSLENSSYSDCGYPLE